MSDTFGRAADEHCFALYPIGAHGVSGPLPVAVRHARDCGRPDTHVLPDTAQDRIATAHQPDRAAHAKRRPASPATGEAGESGRFNVQL